MVETELLSENLSIEKLNRTNAPAILKPVKKVIDSFIQIDAKVYDFT